MTGIRSGQSTLHRSGSQADFNLSGGKGGKHQSPATLFQAHSNAVRLTASVKKAPNLMRAAPGHQSACGPKPPQPHTSFSPGTARPLRATRRRRSRQNQEREKRSHLFYRGFVFRAYARLNVFLLIQPPHCRAYTLHVFIIGKVGTFLITSLCIELFPSICRMGVFLHQISAFFAMPHIQHVHFPALLSLISSVIPARYQNETRTHSQAWVQR